MHTQLIKPHLMTSRYILFKSKQPSKKMMIFEEENEEMKNQGNPSAFTPRVLPKDQISYIQFIQHQQSSQKVEAIKNLPPCKRIRKNQGKKSKVFSQQQKQRDGDAKLRKQAGKETVYKRKALDTMPILTIFETAPNKNFENAAAMRQAYDEKITLKHQLSSQNNFHLAAAQFKAIQLDDSQLIDQSIEYISNLAQKSKLSASAKKTLSEKSISYYFSQLFGEEFKTSFAKYSTAMLDDRLLQIMRQFKEDEKDNSSSLRIQFEILAYFLKIFYQIHEYIPPKEANYGYTEGPLRAVIKLLSIDLEQLRELKRIFVENMQQIDYFEQIWEISHLANAYYLIAIKQRVVARQYYRISMDSLEITINELRAHKAQVMQDHKNKIANYQKMSLSELYEKRTRKRELHPSSAEKFLKVMENYEQIIKKYGVYVTLAKVKQIKIHYGKDFRRDQFHRFVENQMRIHEQFKNKINFYKNALITRQLVKDPQRNYGEAANKIYRKNSFYIKQDYFNNNLFSILLKEVQYQQLTYIRRWFKWINECNSNDLFVIFLDSVSLKEEEEQEDEQQEQMMIPSVSIAVTLKGALLCKTCIKPMNQVELLKQYSKMLDEIRPSIILLFDDQFPLSLGWEEHEQVLLLRKTHTVLVLPRISLLPSPCKVIADCLKSVLPQHLSGVEEFKEAIQNAIQKFDEEQVKEIVDKEWEKVEKFTSAWSPALLDGQNKKQPSRMNGEEDGQNIVKELERYGKPKKQKLSKYNYSQYFEELIEQESQEESLILLQSPDDTKRQEAKASNEGTSFPIMENLKYKSVDDLRTDLAHLLTRNKKIPFFTYLHTASNPNAKEIEKAFQFVQDLGI